MTVNREGELVNWSYTEYLKDITSVAKAFVHLGLEHHNGVAIWGFNSPEWFISDVAAIFAGGVVSSRKTFLQMLTALFKFFHSIVNLQQHYII